MSDSYIAALNGRKIPKEDKVFGISRMAKAYADEHGPENTINATIGALMDDQGKLIVLSSVDKVFHSLAPEEYAAYAPISGTPEFRAAAIKSALGDFTTERHIRACATMGGTGGIKNTVSNYSSPGEAILTPDWFWAPYGNIAAEMGRSQETFPFFTEDGKFNIRALSMKVKDMLERQERLIIILNTPAHNPTGYGLTLEDWENILACLEEARPDRKIALLVDAAYIDFAGEEEKVREFLPVLDRMPANVLPIIGYSMSKTFTLYGMRCGAAICLAPTEEIAEEFAQVNEFSCRASWSNPNRAAQSIISKIYADPALYEAVSEERRVIRDMLLRRGRAFEEAAREADLKIVPFTSGFFVTIPCDDPEAVAAKLREEGVFLIPLSKGVRASVASISEDVCKILPAKIKAAL